MAGLDYQAVYLYFLLVAAVALATLGVTAAVLPSRKAPGAKYEPYESGIRTTTDLLQERFGLRHYLVGLIFLVFDIEVIFLYPWAVVGKELGSFAFYEMAFFLVVLLAGFAYVWKKGGLEWE